MICSKWLLYISTSLSFLTLLSGCDDSSPGQALGTLERDRITLTATASQIITELPVPEGIMVKPGQLLVQLDNTQQKFRVSVAKANQNQAFAALEKLRNGARQEDVAAARARVSGAKANLSETSKSYERTLELVQKKFANESDLDQALARRDSAKATLKDLQEQLQVLTTGTRPEDLDKAEAAYNSASAQLELEQSLLADLSIRATRKGLLNELPWHLGERIPQGGTAAIIQSGTAPYARIYVPEIKRPLLRINDSLNIHIDGVRENYEGKIRWISTEPAFTPYYALNAEDRARLVYMAEVQLPEQAAQLPSGLPVQVDMPNE